MSRFANLDYGDYSGFDDREWLRDREQEAAYEQAMAAAAAAEAEESAFLRKTKLRRWGRESARRKKAFAKARQVLAVTAKMRGIKDNTAATAYNRSGQAAELSLRQGDHEFVWQPRAGYFYREVEIPF